MANAQALMFPDAEQAASAGKTNPQAKNGFWVLGNGTQYQTVFADPIELGLGDAGWHVVDRYDAQGQKINDRYGLKERTVGDTTGTSGILSGANQEAFDTPQMTTGAAISDTS